MFIGVDIGGTNIAVGIINSEGRILSRDETPTGVGRPFEIIIRDMAELINRVVTGSGYKLNDINSIGIGCPGMPDNNEGTFYRVVNVGWEKAPVRPELEKYFDLPIYLENDANAAAYAEVVAGACKGVDNSLLLTLGTGIGSGIIIGGRPYSGAHSVGGEIGHTIIQANGHLCRCGNRGCFEKYASATALIRDGREAAQANPESLIYRSVDGDIDQITAKTVVDAARVGDKIALKVFDQYIFYLAMGIINIINTIDPEVIAFGGGVAKAGEFLLIPLREKVKKHIFFKTAPYAKITTAILGNDAGIIGAALLGKL